MSLVVNMGPELANNVLVKFKCFGRKSCKIDSSKLCEFCILWVFFFKLGDSGESGDFW